MRSLLVAFSCIILLGSGACVKKYTCTCYVKDTATGNVIDTRDFSFKGKDSRSTEQRKTDCAATAAQVNDQYNKAETECIAE